MKFLYLTSETASSIYDWKWVDHDFRNGENFTECIICDPSMKGHFDMMLDDIRATMRNHCTSGFISQNTYYYLTTEYASHIKKLKVIKAKVCNTQNNKYNYFATEADAVALLNAIKDIFCNYGIVLP